MESYRSPWWLPGRHLQTILPGVVNTLFPWPSIKWKRTRWDTPDKDFIDVDWTGNASATRLLVLFHGLEGNRDAHYARSLAQWAVAGGWRFAFVNFRGCSGEPNNTCRAYHAGDSDEIDWILRKFSSEHEHVCAAGVSLGGNALLKWLGEQGMEAAKVVRCAAAISAPFDLASFSPSLARGFSRVYGWYFLYATPMRRKAFAILKRCPNAFCEQALREASTLPEFENAVTAPLHGFKNAQDYWARASALPMLCGIRVPTLILNARNDPFLPDHVLAAVQWNIDDLSEQVILEFPAQGGHAGFPGRDDWMARRVFEFFSPPG